MTLPTGGSKALNEAASSSALTTLTKSTEPLKSFEEMLSNGLASLALKECVVAVLVPLMGGCTALRNLMRQAQSIAAMGTASTMA